MVESLIGEPIDDEDEYDQNMAGRGHNLRARASPTLKQDDAGAHSAGLQQPLLHQELK